VRVHVGQAGGQAADEVAGRASSCGLPIPWIAADEAAARLVVLSVGASPGLAPDLCRSARLSGRRAAL